MSELLKETPILDFSSENIKDLIEKKGWAKLGEVDKVGAVYNFVRDEIKFGYNRSDNISASEVLADGYGQCNTKSILLMALLRVLGVECRIHGFTIDKSLQKGAITGFAYFSSPKNIVHSWVEVKVKGSWFDLEGVILDKKYLEALKTVFPNSRGTFCGYAVYIEDFPNFKVDWNLNSTYIQSKGINQDFGIFNSPDEFFSKYSQKLSPFKEFLYKNFVRKKMNRVIKNIRAKAF